MRILYAAGFCFVYLRELLLATARLAWLVVRPHAALRPHFVEVPLDLRGEFPTLLFVCLVSMTPGSLSVALDRERNVLLVHLIDSQSPSADVEEIKTRFEAPLRRIFGQDGPKRT